MTTDQTYGVPLPTPAAAALDNADLPCAFWDADLSADSNHPDALAIQALREESSPAERAETLKVQGNDALARGLQLGKRFYVAEAVKLYTQALGLIAGLEGTADDGLPALRVALLSNRAQAHLTLRNDRSALADATAATAADASAVKAWHRAVRAAGRLGEWGAADAAVAGGLAAAPGHAALTALSAELAASRAKAEAAAAARAAAAAAARAPAAAVAAAIAAHGVRVGLPQLDRVGARKPTLSPDDKSTLLWPLVFVYPEAGGARDVVEAASEGVPLAAHLDEMFCEAAPPLEWNDSHAYTRSTVELYYLSHATQPLEVPALIECLHGGWPEGVAAAPPERYGPRAARWVRVDESLPLADVLAAPDLVVPGVPVFFVVARGTAYRDRFVASEGFD